MAKLFIEHGARVVAADWNADAVNAAVASIGGSIVGITANVAEEDQCVAMVDKAVNAFGRIDVLVNNAGVMDLFQSVADVDNTTWRRCLSVNLDGPMFAMRRAVPLMLKQGSTAFQYARLGLRCNAVASGGVATSIMQSVDQSRLDQAALGRVGAYHAANPGMLEPIDIANLALFLASDESRHINGAIIPADMGWTAA